MWRLLRWWPARVRSGAAPPDVRCGPSRPSLTRISASLWLSMRRSLLYAVGTAPDRTLAREGRMGGRDRCSLGGACIWVAVRLRLFVLPYEVNSWGGSVGRRTLEERGPILAQRRNFCRLPGRTTRAQTLQPTCLSHQLGRLGGSANARGAFGLSWPATRLLPPAEPDHPRADAPPRAPPRSLGLAYN